MVDNSPISSHNNPEKRSNPFKKILNYVKNFMKKMMKIISHLLLKDLKPKKIKSQIFQNLKHLKQKKLKGQCVKEKLIIRNKNFQPNLKNVGN
jgi:hypothetical protein